MNPPTIKISNVTPQQAAVIAEEWQQILARNPNISPQKAALLIGSVLNKYGLRAENISFN